MLAAKKHKTLVAAAIGTVAMAFAVSPTAHARVDFGKTGSPVELVIGYQPYYTESWSGVVNNGKQLWKKYLPAGSTAEFQIGLQGSVIVNAMTGEKQHIGYMGDMPAIASTFRNLKERGGTDIRIVAALGTSKQQCNIFLVRNDAPQFSSGKDAVKWMDGKVTSAPHGACTDRFARLAFQKAGIKPKRYLNQNIEVITTNFRAGKLDAAAIWEPTASKIVKAGIARRAASGEDFDALDGAFMVMLNDLIEQRPDVQKGWLEAELDAQLFLADPKNADEVASLAEQQTEAIDRKVLWHALYGGWPANEGGGKVKVQLDFIVTDRVQSLLDDATAFLYSLPKKPAAAAKIRDGGVTDAVARQILKERGLSSPLAVVEAKSGM
ncbi:MAG: ABC transporter substrate-binding protein [Gammaproteobacteria bacterium]|nr:ABC transporter substrate-binding protein [Gammaproteobacteria bacterium]NIM74084.1 ABC transporter substrate-binding protein [Gammaproteobacteria bacterium]NIN38967.1 ABC transporter substrate-binding protein [Gammaproteobacteria bacterium]NIO25860.1 ABC transporter substrate-binding protein [Gammaproteobacteria bacterium]NIO66491.1 ABC transporter substrate-binding protein [Gammaproteobacteria bacterium]